MEKKKYTVARGCKRVCKNASCQLLSSNVTISLLETHFVEAKLGLIMRKSPLYKVKVDSKRTL